MPYSCVASGYLPKGNGPDARAQKALNVSRASLASLRGLFPDASAAELKTLGVLAEIVLQKILERGGTLGACLSQLALANEFTWLQVAIMALVTTWLYRESGETPPGGSRDGNNYRKPSELARDVVLKALRGEKLSPDEVLLLSSKAIYACRELECDCRWGVPHGGWIIDAVVKTSSLTSKPTTFELSKKTTEFAQVENRVKMALADATSLLQKPYVGWKTHDPCREEIIQEARELMFG